jgi:anti-anti-sigma factor
MRRQDRAATHSQKTRMYIIEVYEGTPVVRVRGEADLTSASDFRKTLMSALEQPVPRVVVALDECTYFDATAVGILIGTQKKVGERLVVVAPAENIVRTALDRSGLAQHLVLASSLDEAVTGLAP